MVVPPPGAGKQPYSYEEDYDLGEGLSGAEQKKEEDNPNQGGCNGGKVVFAEVVEKTLNFVQVHKMSMASGAEAAIIRQQFGFKSTAENAEATDSHRTNPSFRATLSTLATRVSASSSRSIFSFNTVSVRQDQTFLPVFKSNKLVSR
jgi:hypothetical protein